ncbi:MAG: hypothetical protein JNM56_06260 [Planctomycetia bacterium]|nr:hypothetical protein [Planctomycetia bacterium]
MASVSITFPPHNSNVPGGGNFVTYGTMDPTSADKSAWVMDGTTKITGEETEVPSGQTADWAFAFEDVPTGHAVLLTVKVETNKDSGDKTHTITCVQ